MSKPVLTIGIIFKNERRCLERCLESLQPLRDVIACEVVMADTGSDDGSREIAERYADVLFDFPWVNDFAAARNAVLDRSSGAWYLTLDADEWLNGDVRELVSFLENKGDSEEVAGVTIRNYMYEIGGEYSDFLAVRMARVSAGLRYRGRIHEHWAYPDSRIPSVYPLRNTIAYHDGYIMLNDDSKAGEEKRQRNKELLEKQLEEHPNDQQILIQYIQNIGNDYQAQIPYIRRGMGLLNLGDRLGRAQGGNFMRLAIRAAAKLDLPEYREWLTLAEEQLPDSIYTMIDIQADAISYAWKEMNCREIIRRSERYLEGLERYRTGRFDAVETLQSPLACAVSYSENIVRICSARALVYEGRAEEALKRLEQLTYRTFDDTQTALMLETILRLHTLSEADASALLRTFWTKINEPEPSQEMADKRRRSFIRTAADELKLKHIDNEIKKMNGEITLDGIGEMRAAEWNVFNKQTLRRPGYTLFTALAGETEIGNAAVLMDETDVEAAARLLKEVKRYEELPIQALCRALVRGVTFPLAERPLHIEEMDRLAIRMAQDKENLRTLVERAAENINHEDWQTLLWTRGLVLAAVQTCAWEDEARDMDLARIFAKVEQVFLPAYYSPEVLREETVCVLPAMHRSGWYCARAFAALEAGDKVGCVRNLREGLASCEDMKPMVEFLLDHIPGLQAPSPNSELLELAEKVRVLLAAYPPDDPVVAALKASPAYQQVAHLIEGPDLGILGRLAQ